MTCQRCEAGKMACRRVRQCVRAGEMLRRWRAFIKGVALLGKKRSACRVTADSQSYIAPGNWRQAQSLQGFDIKNQN